RSGPHVAVSQEPQELGARAACRGHRRLELVPRRDRRVLVRRGPSVVRLPRHQGHQQLDAVRRMQKAMSRRGKGGRKKKRGRKSRKAKAAAARRGMTVKEKAYFVFKHRYL